MDREQMQGFLQQEFSGAQPRTIDQDALMRFDPATGRPNPYPSHAGQYRGFHGQVAWLYCPWTGRPRHALDVGSDVFGRLIRPPGTESRPAGGMLGAEKGEYGEYGNLINSAEAIRRAPR